MFSDSKRLQIIGFFALLFIIDWFLYFRFAGHFFQADTVFLLDHRASSVSGLLHEFTKVQASGRYRPLTHPLIPSMVYPIFGLHPIPYRIPVYAIFFADTIAVYALAFAFSRKRLTAALAAFFFDIHTINAYTTYDVGFAPELLYTLFYIGSVLGYLKYLQSGTKTGYRLSMACLVASLLSKEGAVTLPVILFLLDVCSESGSRSVGQRFIRAARSTLPHMAIVSAYLIFIFGYLNVMNVSLAQLLKRPRNPEAGGYTFVLDNTVLKNADLALTWAFNIPRGWWGQWRPLTTGALAFLKVFRALVLILGIILLVKGERKVILIGAAWFFITIVPVLPLLDHLIPYYLFLPLAGLSVVIGVVFAWAHDALRHAQPIAAMAFVVLVFAGTLFVTSPGIHQDIQKNRLLGGSAELAMNSVMDLHAMYPALPPNATVYFDDTKEPLYWDQSWGGLLRMAYKSDQLAVRYSSLDDPLLPGRDNTFMLGVRDKHLFDRTAEYRASPKPFINYTESQPYKLKLSATEVTAGRDTYAVDIDGLHDVPIRFVYQLNDEPPDTFEALLDAHGRVSFPVGSSTRKGVYRFMAFKISGQVGWMRSEETITVR